MQRLPLAFDFHPRFLRRSEVPQIGGEQAAVWQPHLADRELDRKRAAVGPHALDLDAAVQHGALACLQIARQTGGVALPQRGRHDQIADRLADRVGALIAEGLLRRGIELGDETCLVDRDDAVERRGGDGGVDRFARLQGRELIGHHPLAALQLGQVAREDEIAFDRARFPSIGEIDALHQAVAARERHPALPPHRFARQGPLGVGPHGVKRCHPEDLGGAAADDLIDALADEGGIIIVHVTVNLAAIQQRDAGRHGIEDKAQPRVGENRLRTGHGLAGVNM